MGKFKKIDFSNRKELKKQKFNKLVILFRYKNR